MNLPEPNEGKSLAINTSAGTFLRIPMRTRLVKPGDDLMALIDEYAKPYIQPGDILFVSEKIVCITQNRFVKAADVKTTRLARFLASKVQNHLGTPQFRGFGHGTAPAMQLLIDEAGYARALFAAAVAAVTRPLGIKGAFYYLVGKQAKSIDCPMSWTIPEFKDMAKLAPKDPNGVAQKLKARYGVEAVVVDANYRGAISLGKTTSAITEKFILEVLKDNPAGQNNEMTPFLVVRKKS
ncbi:MAG: coenzyme F420-0:L-glutamate ligase [Patescibacteria group bacterium]|nr:coenzyme F420-0:L-glutamate ligase [Patescibacteria group bacterium]